MGQQQMELVFPRHFQLKQMGSKDAGGVIHISPLFLRQTLEARLDDNLVLRSGSMTDVACVACGKGTLQLEEIEAIQIRIWRNVFRHVGNRYFYHCSEMGCKATYVGEWRY